MLKTLRFIAEKSKLHEFIGEKSKLPDHSVICCEYSTCINIPSSDIPTDTNSAEHCQKCFQFNRIPGDL